MIFVGGQFPLKCLELFGMNSKWVETTNYQRFHDRFVLDKLVPRVLMRFLSVFLQRIGASWSNECLYILQSNSILLEAVAELGNGAVPSVSCPVSKPFLS